MFDRLFNRKPQIICPRCLTAIRVNDERVCPVCAYQIPAKYSSSFSDAPPLFFPTFGWPQHGKTTYLYVLRLLLMNMSTVWSNYYRESASQLDIDLDRTIRSEIEKGLFPSPTPLRDQSEVYINYLHNLPRWGSRNLIIKDYAGELFENFDVDVETVRSFVRIPTLVMFISIADLLQDKSRSGRSIDQLLNIYLETLARNKVNLRSEIRNLIVVFTKADLLAQLPSNIRNYLVADDLWTQIRGKNRSGQLQEDVNLEEYLERMSRVSDAIRDWLRSSSDIFGGANFVTLVNRHNLRTVYSVVSATGATPHDNMGALEINPLRVLDPLFWALELQSQGRPIINKEFLPKVSREVSFDSFVRFAEEINLSITKQSSNTLQYIDQLNNAQHEVSVERTTSDLRFMSRLMALQDKSSEFLSDLLSQFGDQEYSIELNKEAQALVVSYSIQISNDAQRNKSKFLEAIQIIRKAILEVTSILEEAIEVSSSSEPQDKVLQALTVLQGHTSWIGRIAWSPDGSRLASASGDRTIRIWNPQTGKNLLTLSGHTAAVYAVAWSPDGTLLASGGDDYSIRIWDVQSGEVVLEPNGHTARIEYLDWSSDGRFLASASADETVKVWDTDTGKLVRSIAHSNWVNAVAWSPDGSQLASGDESNAVHIWNAENGQRVRTFRGHTDWVITVMWSHAANWIASASRDGTIRIWNPQSNEALHVIQAHSGGTRSITFSHGDRLLASKGSDNTVKLWRTDTWELIATLDEPTHNDIEATPSLAFHPSEMILATIGANDEIIRIWSIDDDLTKTIASAKRTVQSTQSLATDPEDIFLVYSPQNSYSVGQKLIFTEFDNGLGTVVGVRSGNNPDIGDFDVIEVEFEDNELIHKQFASNLKSPHKLNNSALEYDEIPTKVVYFTFVTVDELRVIQPCNITLGISTTKPSAQSLAFSIPYDTNEITVKIRSRNLNINSSSTYTVNLSFPDTRSISIQSLLPGKAKIILDLFVDSLLVGGLSHEIFVSAFQHKEISILMLPDPTPPDDEKSAQPDLTLRIYSLPLDELGEMLRFYVIAYSDLSYLNLRGRSLGYRDVPRQYVEFIQGDFRRIVKAGISSNGLYEIGKLIWQEIIPADMRKLYNQINSDYKVDLGVRSILLICDDYPWLPYELATPREHALCQEFEITRWIEGQGQIRRGSFPLGPVYVTQDADISSTLPEYTSLVWNDDDGGMVEPRASTDLSDDRIQGFHFVRAAGALRGKANQLSTILQGVDFNEYLRQQTDRIQAKTPLISVSTLSSTTEREIVQENTFLEFIRSGASAVIGTWWSTNPADDRIFWRVFYESISKGKSLGEAVLDARRAVKMSGEDPSSNLAYFAIGDPMASGYHLVDGLGYLEVKCISLEDSTVEIQKDQKYTFLATLRRKPPAHYNGQRCHLMPWHQPPVNLGVEAPRCEITRQPIQSMSTPTSVTWEFEVSPKETGRTVLFLEVTTNSGEMFIQTHKLELQISATSIAEPPNKTSPGILVDLTDKKQFYHVNNLRYPYGSKRPKPREIRRLYEDVMDIVASSNSENIGVQISDLLYRLMDNRWWEGLEPKTNITLIDTEYILPWEFSALGSDFWGNIFNIGHLQSSVGSLSKRKLIRKLTVLSDTELDPDNHVFSYLNLSFG